MADIRAGTMNQQVVTVKDFQRLMDLFTLNLTKTIDGIFQKYSVEMHIDLPVLNDLEDNQDVMPLEEEEELIKAEMKDNIAEIPSQSDVSIQLKELQVDVILQPDTFGNKEDTSKIDLKKISFRRDRLFQLSQPQIKNLKFLKIESGEGATLKELMKKKGLEEIQKEGNSG